MNNLTTTLKPCIKYAFKSVDVNVETMYIFKDNEIILNGLFEFRF